MEYVLQIPARGRFRTVREQREIALAPPTPDVGSAHIGASRSAPQVAFLCGRDCVVFAVPGMAAASGGAMVDDFAIVAPGVLANGLHGPDGRSRAPCLAGRGAF